MAVLQFLPFLALVASVAGITTNSWTAVNRWRYGGFGSPFSSRARTIFRSVDRTEPWSPLWRDTGTVPDLISQAGSSCVLSSIKAPISGAPWQITSGLPTWDQHPAQRHGDHGSSVDATPALVAHSTRQPLHGDHRRHRDRCLARRPVLPLGRCQYSGARSWCWR